MGGQEPLHILGEADQTQILPHLFVQLSEPGGVSCAERCLKGPWQILFDGVVVEKGVVDVQEDDRRRRRHR